MNDRETTRQTLDHAAALLEEAAQQMNSVNDYMRRALELFQKDPPDSDFQRGYMEGLKVFANEALCFKWDNPLLWGDAEPAPERLRKPPLRLVSDNQPPRP